MVVNSYLLGSKFLPRTDHSGLQWLRRTPVPMGQQARWLNTIKEFDFQIQHRAGTSHSNADALSRRPYPVQTVNRITDSREESRRPEPWARVEQSNEQMADPDLGWVRWETDEAPEPAEIKRMSAVVKLLVAQWPQIEVSDGLLQRNWLDVEDSSVRWCQIILPPSRRQDFIKLSHEEMTVGHLGIRRTSAQVQRRAYWPSWRRDVGLYQRRCAPCAGYIRGKPGHQGRMQNMVVGEVGEVLSLDLTGPHVVSSLGNKYVLTMVDYFRRYAEAIAVGNQEASTVARVLLDNWISRYGCPLQILTDQGPCFEAALFKDLCRLLGVSKIRTSPYKASSNGLLERFHRTLNSLLAKFISETHKNWGVQLQFVMAAYRTSQHTSMGYSPNKLFLNREVCLPLDLVMGECLDRDAPT